MHLFFMHLRTDGELLKDEEGASFNSLGEAVAAAVTAARDIMSSEVRKGELKMNQQIEIVGPGSEEAVVRFVEVLTIRQVIV